MFAIYCSVLCRLNRNKLLRAAEIKQVNALEITFVENPGGKCTCGINVQYFVKHHEIFMAKESLVFMFCECTETNHLLYNGVIRALIDQEICCLLRKCNDNNIELKVVGTDMDVRE